MQSLTKWKPLFKPQEKAHFPGKGGGRSADKRTASTTTLSYSILFLAVEERFFYNERHFPV